MACCQTDVLLGKRLRLGVRGERSERRFLGEHSASRGPVDAARRREQKPRDPGLLRQLGIGTFAIYVMDFGAAVGFRLALRHPGRLSAIIAQNAPLYPWEPLGWWATLGQYWADGSAAHRQAARSYPDQEGLRGQYLDLPDPEQSAWLQIQMTEAAGNDS